MHMAPGTPARMCQHGGFGERPCPGLPMRTASRQPRTPLHVKGVQAQNSQGFTLACTLRLGSPVARCAYA